MTQVFGYKLTALKRDAPCIQNSLYSLALCQRPVRQRAKIGDIVFGFGSRHSNNNGQLLYCAKITHTIPSPDYYSINADNHHFNRRDCVYKYNPYDKRMKFIGNRDFDYFTRRFDTNINDSLTNGNVVLSNQYFSFFCDTNQRFLAQNILQNDYSTDTTDTTNTTNTTDETVPTTETTNQTQLDSKDNQELGNDDNSTINNNDDNNTIATNPDQRWSNTMHDKQKQRAPTRATDKSKTKSKSVIATQQLPQRSSKSKQNLSNCNQVQNDYREIIEYFTAKGVGAYNDANIVSKMNKLYNHMEQTFDKLTPNEKHKMRESDVNGYDPHHEPNQKKSNLDRMINKNQRNKKKNQDISQLSTNIHDKGAFDENINSLIETLNSFKIPNNYGRKIARGTYHPSSAPTITFGELFHHQSQKQIITKATINSIHVFKKLIDFASNMIGIEIGKDYTSICLNKNFRCDRHRDNGNVGNSYIIAVGNFNGGELSVENTNTKVIQTHNIRNRFIKFDGTNPHWVEPFDFNFDYNSHCHSHSLESENNNNNKNNNKNHNARYSIVYYTHKDCGELISQFVSNMNNLHSENEDWTVETAQQAIDKLMITDSESCSVVSKPKSKSMSSTKLPKKPKTPKKEKTKSKLETSKSVQTDENLGKHGIVLPATDTTDDDLKRLSKDQFGTKYQLDFFSNILSKYHHFDHDQPTVSTPKILNCIMYELVTKVNKCSKDGIHFELNHENNYRQCDAK